MLRKTIMPREHFITRTLLSSMKRCLLIFITFLFFLPTASAAGRFEWTPDAKAAYENIITLKLAQAERLIIQMKQNDPENYMVYHLENYVDFFRVFINEDKTQFARLEQNKDRRLSKIKTGDSSSPYYLYIQADIRLQWALARLKFEEYATAFLETNKAFKLLTQNQEKFPDFMPNKKDLGILHAMVGTIPDNYKWAVEMLTSMEGTIEDGRAELEEVIDYSRGNDFIFETETYVFYAYLMLHLGNEEDAAWRFINRGKRLDHTKNPLAAFIKANIAMRTNRNDEAIQILQNRARGRDYHPFQYLDYMLGSAKLNRLDKDANVYLKRYINQFRGRNFIKDTYRRLAWHALINNNPVGYYNYMQKVKTKGYTVVGGDGSALKEANTGQLPNVELLKARLLFDGGYFKKPIPCSLIKKNLRTKKIS